MKLWSTLEAPIKLGRWNFNSFAVERMSRKHREVETEKERGSDEGAREKDGWTRWWKRERERRTSVELRLTVDFALELIYRDRQHHWSSNGTRDSPLWGKFHERNAIASAWSAFIIPIVIAKVDEIQNPWCRSHVAWRWG